MNDVKLNSEILCNTIGVMFECEFPQGKHIIFLSIRRICDYRKQSWACLGLQSEALASGNVALDQQLMPCVAQELYAWALLVLIQLHKVNVITLTVGKKNGALKDSDPCSLAHRNQRQSLSSDSSSAWCKVYPCSAVFCSLNGASHWESLICPYLRIFIQDAGDVPGAEATSVNIRQN